MNLVELTNAIKKLLVEGLTPSEMKRLSDEEPMRQIHSKQWEESARTQMEEKVNKDQIWENISTLCWGEDNPVGLKHRKLNLFKTGSYAAAAVIVLLIVGIWITRSISPEYITVTASTNERLALTLPDSSKVWLNASGKLRYRSAFNSNRELFLEGEAFFDVVKRPDSPFRVHIKDACVEVKGTEFNIKTEYQLAEITLFSGKVEFTGKDIKEAVVMSPSQQIIYNATTHQVTLSKVDIEEYDWRSEEYSFIDKPLRDLVRFINRSYEVNVVIKNPTYESYLFSGKIRKHEKLSDVIDKICITLDLKQNKKEETITLY